MARFEVDVKAFANITVEADDEDDARKVADAFVEECLSATHQTVIGYNSGLPEDTVGKVVPADYSMLVDGDSEVEEANDE